MLKYSYLFHLPNMFRSARLLYRAESLCFYLEQQGIRCRITKFLRKPRTAHRWSTAHHIVNGGITLEQLRRLEGGRDLDGNVWYKPEWDAGGDGGMSANTSEQIKQNAIQQGPPHTVYSEEGYAPNDPARLPNLPEVPISKHVYGLAVDMFVEWDRLGGAWSDSAQALVARFGLARPVASESWHFELGARNESRPSALQVARWVIRSRRKRTRA